MFTAAAQGDLARVRQQIEKGSAPNKSDDYGYTPLHLASQHGHVAIVQYLLGARARPDPCECGATPLHRAAFAGEAACVALLLARGADAGARDASFGDRRTPLHKACSRGALGVARALLAHAPALVTVFAEDARGLTPLDCLELEGTAFAGTADADAEGVARLLAEHGATRGSGRAAAEATAAAVAAVSTAPAAAAQPTAAAAAVEAQPPSPPQPAKPAAAAAGIVCKGCEQRVVAVERTRCCGAFFCEACVRRWRVARVARCVACRGDD